VSQPFGAVTHKSRWQVRPGENRRGGNEMNNTQTQTEAAKLMEVLEDAYWRLKDLDTQDLAEDEDMDDKVSGIISGLDEYFA
jgi:hypothetical protein